MTRREYLTRFLSSLPAWSKATGYSVPRLALSYASCYLIHGINSEEFLALRMYKYNHRERRRFWHYRGMVRVSDRLNAGATGEEIALFHRKSEFNAFFHEFVHRDWLYAETSSERELRDFVARNDAFLAKACESTQGKDIYFYRGGEVQPDRFLTDYRGKPYLLEAFIDQHPALAALNASTVNTVRILTLRHGENVTPVGACLRVGGADAYVDNFHSGGVAYPVDLETGIVSQPGRRLLTPERFVRHPSTGHIMPGFQVPHWDKLVETVCRAAVLPEHIGCVGWDVAILPDGVELVEGNVNYPDPIVLQLDEKGVYPIVQRFMRENFSE